MLGGTRLYGMSDKFRGTLFTLDAATGKLLWKNDGNLGANASITDIGSALLVVNDAGELTVHQKSADTLTEVARRWRRGASS